jgi:hypothetical protein
VSDPVPLHFDRQVTQFAAEQEATRAAQLAIAAHHDALSAHHRSIAEHHRALSDELPQMVQDGAEVAMSVAHHDHNNQAMIVTDNTGSIIRLEGRIAMVESHIIKILDLLSARKDAAHEPR